MQYVRCSLEIYTAASAFYCRNCNNYAAVSSEECMGSAGSSVEKRVDFKPIFVFAGASNINGTCAGFCIFSVWSLS